MTLRKMTIGVLVGCVGSMAPAASADPAEQAAKLFAGGNVLLVKADFAGAMKAYAAAAKADPQTQEYRQQYAILRRVMQMREEIDREKNLQRWEAMARALRGFYAGYGIHSEGLAISRQLHAKLGTADSAAMLAEAQMALSLNSDAEKLLAGINEKESTPQVRVLLGIALARQKKTDEARAVMAKCAPAARAGARFFYDVARLKALTGDFEGAIEWLTKAFEETPPSRLDAARSCAREDKDFAGVAGSDAFAAALKTASRIKESGCSGASDCGSCPYKAGCGASRSPGCTNNENDQCPAKK